MKTKTETVEIIVPVEIKYSTPEGRKDAIKWACRGIHLDGWSSGSGGHSVKATGKGREA